MTSLSFILPSPAAIPQISALPVEKAAFALWQSEWRQEFGLPFAGPPWQREMGRAAEGSEGHPRQTDTQFKMPPSAQHSFGFWCPDSLTLSFSADSSTTPSTNHRADLYEKNSTLLVQLVSPKDEILSPVQTSIPGHAACRACLKTLPLGRRAICPLKRYLAISRNILVTMTKKGCYQTSAGLWTVPSKELLRLGCQ